MQPLLRAIYGLLHRPLLEFETDEDTRVAEELYLWCVMGRQTLYPAQ